MRSASGADIWNSVPSDAGHGLAAHARGARQRRIAEPHIPRLGRGRSRPARLWVGADTLALIRRRFQAASAATYETWFEGSRVDPSGDGGAPDHRLGLRMTARW